jgi:hypothetical protein
MGTKLALSGGRFQAKARRRRPLKRMLADYRAMMLPTQLAAEFPLDQLFSPCFLLGCSFGDQWR